jgi:hypothetical protein
MFFSIPHRLMYYSVHKTPQMLTGKSKNMQRQAFRFKRKKSDSAEEHNKDEKVYASLLGSSTLSMQMSNHQINR